jgi:hypothetical protein
MQMFRDRVFASAWCAYILAAGTCLAQSNLASISGIVADPQSAMVPRAAVIATNVGTGVQTRAATNAAGFYNVQNLSIGVYDLSVEHPGFRKYIRTGITLATGERLGLDIQLELGATGQSVTVAAEAPLVENRSSEINTLIESKSIDALPLGNRRTLNVVQLSGAAVFVNYPNTPANVTPNFSIAGGRTQSQMAWIDGGNAQNMRMGAAQINLDPPVETIEEVKVLANNYSAEYGASASGVVIETTKSGTNHFHGSAYEFFRNNAMDAPGFFAPIVNGRKVSPELRYNVFGATTGGPIRKDKTFFFLAYEGQRLHTSSNTVLTVPTLLQRGGDFSQTFTTAGKLIPIYDPATTQLINGSYTRQPFPGNVILPSGQDPVAAAMTAYYPLPNQFGNIAGANNFSGNPVTISPANFYMIKGDHNFSSNDRVTGRYMRVSGTSSIASVYPSGGAGDPTNFALNQSQYMYADWTHVIGATQVNDLRFTYNDRMFHNLSAGMGGNYPSKLGLKGVPDDAFPRLAPAGFAALGATQQERRQYPIRQQQVLDNYALNRGRHALKFGFEVRRSFNQDVLLNQVSGSFSFSTQPTSFPGNTATGNGLASMLAGFVTGFSENQTEPLLRHSYYLGGFAQDNWTLSHDLTLNFGLRWETDTPMVDDNNRMNSFDPDQINPVSGTPGVVKFLGRNSYSSSPYATHWRNFGPRLGFAWKPFGSGKTVIRGGAGMFFAHPFDAGVPNANALGFSVAANLNTPDQGITAPFYLREGVPVSASASALNDSFGAVPVGQATTTSVTFFDPHRGLGYSEQFNFGIQREVAPGTLIEIGALGNLSRKLANANLSLNQIAPQILSPLHSSQKDRPFPQFTDVAIQNPTLGVSNYYAAVLRIEKHYSRGLSFGANYTWSKYLGDINMPGTAEGNDAGTYSNYYNRRADYGPTANDIAHRVNFHWIYELPFGPGKPWLSHSPFGRLAGGWSIGNVATFQTGAANTITNQTNNCNCFSAGAQRPTVLTNPNLASDQRSILAWFNTTAFAQPAAYTFGNAGIGIVRGPGLINVDFSVLRSFRVSERIHAEFRCEFFNALNHTNLGNPGAVFGSPTFGVISSAGPARQIEAGARIQF